MNRHTALVYAMSTSEPVWPVSTYKIDIRLTALVAAMHEQERTYDQVGLSEWWSARCQLGMLIGREVPEFDFKALIPCGKAGALKAAGADDFCDERYRPSREKAIEGLRRVKLMILGIDTPRPEVATHQSTMSFVKDGP
jgi:hypothetical protein